MSSKVYQQISCVKTEFDNCIQFMGIGISIIGGGARIYIYAFDNLLKTTGFKGT